MEAGLFHGVGDSPRFPLEHAPQYRVLIHDNKGPLGCEQVLNIGQPTSPLSWTEQSPAHGVFFVVLPRLPLLTIQQTSSSETWPGPSLGVSWVQSVQLLLLQGRIRLATACGRDGIIAM